VLAADSEGDFALDLGDDALCLGLRGAAAGFGGGFRCGGDEVQAAVAQRGRGKDRSGRRTRCAR